MDTSIKEELYSLIDEEYREQQKKDYPADARQLLGIPIATLCETAREYACRKDWQEIVDSELTDATFEEVLLQVLIAGYANQNFEEAKTRIMAILPKIDSNQLCDAICLAFRTAIEYPEETLSLVEELLKVQEGYEQRFAIVLLLDYFVNSDYIDKTLTLYAAILPESPIVMQALSWGYLVCFLGFEAKTLTALNTSPIPQELRNHIADYILQSPRLTENQRQNILTLKS